MEFKASFAEMFSDFISFFSAYVNLQSSYPIQHLLSCQISLRTLLSPDVSFHFQVEHAVPSKRLGRQNIHSRVSPLLWAAVSQIIIPEAFLNLETVMSVLKKIDEVIFSNTLGNVSLHMKLSSFCLHSCRIYCSEFCLFGVPGQSSLHGINWT